MRRMAAACAAALTLAGLAFAPAPPSPDPVQADPAAAPTPTGRTIVVLDDDVQDVASVARRLLGPRDLRPLHLYQHALRGFAVDATPEELAGVEDDPDVAHVEADREVRTAAQTVPTGVRRVDAVAAAGIGSRGQVPVDIAILDTGIAAHGDLRVVERLDCRAQGFEASTDYVNWVLFGTCKQGGTDNDGHGTLVAGIAAARDNSSGVVGVAPGARLWAIKVINGTKGGSLADVVAGLDAVTREAPRIEVANISLVARGSSPAMDEAIAGAISEGIAVVVAAGNDSRNAKDTTPANSPGAITVSAVTDLDGRHGGTRSCTRNCYGGDDRFASYSNYGAVVDIAAPGSYIVSTARGGGLDTTSGTSMAAPHVAGAAALRIHQRGFSPVASRSGKVLSDLLSRAAPENTTCGYRGSPSNERLLDLVKGC